jgi:hypothetical protein
MSNGPGVCKRRGTAPRSASSFILKLALLAISDNAIEPFHASCPELGSVIWVHFSGRLATPLAVGAHPLFSFAGTLYDREIYERIPFVIDRGLRLCPT